MKLLFVQAGFGAGGAEKTIASIANHRARQDDEIRVLGLSAMDETSYFSYDQAVGLTPGVARIADTRATIQRRLRLLRSEIQSMRPDVVISFLTKTNTLTLLANIGTSVPTIVSERNNPRQQIAHPVWHHAQLVLARRAAAIVMLTRDSVSQLPEGLRGHTYVIPNPCAVSPELRLRPISECRNLVAVGRLDYQKGFDMLLEAFVRIRRVKPEVQLIVYGEGLERARLEDQAAEIGVRDAVSFPGTTPVPGAWMEKADMLLVTSRHEGLCNVIAEATVHGIPVVSFDCDYGPRELIVPGVNGLLVSARQVSLFANAVIGLIENPALRASFRQAAQLNRERLKPERILKKWDKIINHVANTENTPRGNP